MKHFNLDGKAGYKIPCISMISGEEKMICIVSHGFGSSKESLTAQMLLEELPKNGIGAIAFDWTCHGASEAHYSQFRIKNCLDDLASVEAYISSKYPNADIVYFSSSFGAYLNFLYISTRQHLGKKSFMRSAAVDMPEKFRDIDESVRDEINRVGYTILDDGYTKPLNITNDFIEDLMANDLFTLFKNDGTLIHMIHGDEDETISVKSAKDFASAFGINLSIVPGGIHSLYGEILDGKRVYLAENRVFEEAIDFFKSDILDNTNSMR